MVHDEARKKKHNCNVKLKSKEGRK